MSGSLLPVAQQWFDNNGNPLTDGKIFTYIAGTSTLKDTYSDFDLQFANTNPVILDSDGRASIWGNGKYKIIIKNKNDVTIDTIDDVFLAGSYVEGNFTIDHTTSNSVNPVQITHSNIRLNTDPYGTNSVLIEASGLNNNQPLLFLKYAVNTSSFGNVGPVIWNTGGGSSNYTSTSDFAASLEFISNNSLVNDYNGKFELGNQCGRTTGSTKYRDGYFYIAYRRGPEHPSGANTGFNRVFNLLPNTSIGKGELELLGYGIYINPEWDFGTNSYIILTNQYQDTIWRNEATASGKYARIENVGKTNSYILSRSNDAEGQLFAQGDNSSAKLELRSNWVNTGTSSAYINLYTKNDDSGYRIQANGTNDRLNIRRYDAGVGKDNIDIVPSDNGLVSIYRTDDASKGKIKLGNSSGSAGGGDIEYDSNTGQLDISGTENYITMGSSGLVEPTRLDTASPSSGSTVNPGSSITDYIITSGSLAALTVNLPASIKNGHKLTVMSTGGITALTVTASGGATILGGPTTLSSNGFFTMLYRSSVNTWYRNG